MLKQQRPLAILLNSRASDAEHLRRKCTTLITILHSM